MADNQEKSDDLIAELAKLMASNAQGAESESKPSVIKLAPLGEAPPAAPVTPAATPSPIRIPGMEAPKPAAPPAPPASAPSATAPAAGSVRIPGMDAAKPAPSLPPAAQETPAAETRPAPPPPFPQAVPPRHDTPAATPAPSGLSAAEAAAAFAQPRSTGTPFAAGLRPGGPAAPAVPPAPAAAAPSRPEPVATPAAPLADDDHFDFDFGFDTQPPVPQATTATAPEDDPVPAEEAVADEARDAEPEADAQPETEDDDSDPIALLINAELGAPTAGEGAAQKVQYPASVEAVPASNFGHAAVQAPVLIGHPARVAAPDVPTRAEAPPAAGGDRFAVAPVFGLGSAPQRPEPAAEPETAGSGDPMAEIENLIGEAVRVQLGETEAPQPVRQAEPQPPPVVPPLNTGFAPRRAGLRDVEPRTQSAEAAILAAAAATGAEVGRIEPGMMAEDRPYRRTKVKPPNTRSFGGLRQYIGMGVAAVLLLAAGLGLYWVLNMGRGDPENAPVLTADTSPVKQVPATPAADTAEAPRSVVFDEIDGVAGDAAAETLVSRDDTAEAPITEVARVEEPEVTETGLANRRVRTVTVRPDGTIVSADDAVAGSEALPVERPNVPELPGATEPSELLTATAEAPLEAPSVPDSATPAADDPIAALVAGTAGELPGAAEGGDALQETTELAALSREPEAPVVFDGSLTAPVPMPRPTDRSSLTGGGDDAVSAPVASNSAANEPASIPLVSLTADAPAASTPAPTAAAPAGGSADAYVQLASLPSEGEARSQVNAMQQRWGGLFGGQSLVVQRAELGGGRVTYRLRLPTASLQDATRICASIKANGGDCFATNG